MTLSVRVSLTLRLLAIAVLSGLAWYGLGQAIHWLLFIALTCIATTGVMKRTNILLYWPAGLLLVIVLMYGGYWVQWVGTPTGVDHESANLLFRTLIVLLSLLAVVRTIFEREQIVISSVARMFTVVVMVALPVVLITLVSMRWSNDPVRIISGHLSGGDHGAHNEIIHHLLRQSNKVTFASPLQMYTYPQAVHFVIANLIAVTSQTSKLPLLAQEYAMGAWFEWLQFAAFCQMAIVVFMKTARGSGIRRILYLPAILFAFAAMDNFVVHLLWSGFTTSLAITWILMLFVAVSDQFVQWSCSGRVRYSVVTLLVFAYAGWITYQPYAAIFLALLGLVLLHTVTDRTTTPKGVVLVIETLRRPLVQVSLMAALIVMALIGILGKTSPAVRSLMLDGSTYRPYLYTVLLWAFLAMALSWMPLPHSNETNRILSSFQFLHFGFVLGMASTVVIAGNFDYFNQPYYVQKMLWILLFVSVPVALSFGFTWFEKFQITWNVNMRVGTTFVVLVALFLTPLVQGRLPVKATQKINVVWFAKAMVNHYDDIENRQVAFSWTERLGSHLSNLALHSSSDLVMPVETGISGNAFLACAFMNENKASLVYTTPNGRAEMVASGCDPDITYVESGVVVPHTTIKYFDIAPGVVERPALGQLGFRLLLRGFLPPEKWGTWAGGYRSAIGFNVPRDLNRPMLKVVLRPFANDEEAREVVFRANNEEIGRTTIGFESAQSVNLSMPTALVGQPVELTITCTRTDEEIKKDDPVDGPNSCVGVRSLQLVNGS
jgi:hypothetical protein